MLIARIVSTTNINSPEISAMPPCATGDRRAVVREQFMGSYLIHDRDDAREVDSFALWVEWICERQRHFHRADVAPIRRLHIFRRLVAVCTTVSAGTDGVDAILNGHALYAVHQWSRDHRIGRQTPERALQLKLWCAIRRRGSWNYTERVLPSLKCAGSRVPIAPAVVD